MAATVAGEYSWFDTTTAGLPEEFAVVTTLEKHAVWQPWTYWFPYVDRFIAVDMASIRQLESRLNEVDIDSHQLWSDSESWERLSRYVEPWLGQTAQEISKAALSVCSVIDFEAILIDGAFPAFIRTELG